MFYIQLYGSLELIKKKKKKKKEKKKNCCTFTMFTEPLPRNALSKSITMCLVCTKTDSVKTAASLTEMTATNN
jgi:hypothetical protein